MWPSNLRVKGEGNARNSSQEDLARSIGGNDQRVGRWERQARSIKPSDVYRISSAFGDTMAEFFARVQERTVRMSDGRPRSPTSRSVSDPPNQVVGIARIHS